jgi:two-component system response regulator
MNHKPLRILLVEDNVGDVELVEMALREHEIEHELLVAAEASAAKRLIDRMGSDPAVPCPDCILLDVNLPDASGFEVLAYFRRHRRCARTPAIVMSSSNAVGDRKRSEELGVAAYFRKPSELNDYLKLGSVVREVIHL